MKKYVIGYNTNGFAHHDIVVAIGIMKKLGYGGVAITPDYNCLDPLRVNRPQVRAVAALLKRYRMRSVIETGARFILDPAKKHEPDLLDPTPSGRKRRLDFYARAIGIGREIGAEVFSYWSGRKKNGVRVRDAFRNLVDGSLAINELAKKAGLVVAFEPEPGMFIEDLGGWKKLKREIPDDNFRMTLDTGHVAITEDASAGDVVRKYAAEIANVHLDDSDGKIHEHLKLGEGVVDFGDFFRALAEIGFSGMVGVELSRHSHQAPQAARETIDYIGKIVG